MSDNDKMREVPPITDETYKALMVALGMPNNRSLLSALQQIANHATQRAAWQDAQAEQSVPVVGEPVAEAYVYEDVDGDDILGLRLLKEDYPMQHGEKLYIEPTTSITHAELERLRKDAERYRNALVSIAEYWNADRNDEAMHDACWYAINTASEALGDGRMAAYFYSPDYYRDNRENYGGEWVAKYADGTEIPINCGKDKNIFFYAGDYVKKHGKCTGLLRIDAPSPELLGRG